MSTNLKYLVPLFILIAGSAFANAYNTIGDSVERLIAFIGPSITYLIIGILLAKYRGLTLFKRSFVRYLSFIFIAVTIVETAYPAYIYREQNLPPDLWTVFSIQLLFNLYIVRILTNE